MQSLLRAPMVNCGVADRFKGLLIEQFDGFRRSQVFADLNGICDRVGQECAAVGAGRVCMEIAAGGQNQTVVAGECGKLIQMRTVVEGMAVDLHAVQICRIHQNIFAAADGMGLNHCSADGRNQRIELLLSIIEQHRMLQNEVCGYSVHQHMRAAVFFHADFDAEINGKADTVAAGLCIKIFIDIAAGKTVKISVGNVGLVVVIGENDSADTGVLRGPDDLRRGNSAAGADGGGMRVHVDEHGGRHILSEYFFEWGKVIWIIAQNATDCHASRHFECTKAVN